MGRVPKIEKELRLRETYHGDFDSSDETQSDSSSPRQQESPHNQFVFPVLTFETVNFDYIRSFYIELYSGFIQVFIAQIEQNSIIQTSLLKNTQDLRLSDGLIGIMLDISSKIHILSNYAAILPGLSALNRSDLNIFIKKSLFSLYTMATSRFYTLDGQLSLRLPNGVALNLVLMSETLGDDVTRLIYATSCLINKLELKENELAFLFPFLLTKIEQKDAQLFTNRDLCMQVNSIYAKSLCKEFETNERSNEFYEALLQVIFIYNVHLFQIVINFKACIILYM